MASVGPATAATSTSYPLGGNTAYGNLSPSTGGAASSYATTSFTGTGAVSVSVTYNYRFGAINYSAYGSNSNAGAAPYTSASAVPTYVPAVALSSSATHYATDGAGSWNGSTSG